MTNFPVVRKPRLSSEPPQVFVQLPATKMERDENLIVGDILAQLTRISRPDDDTSGSMMDREKVKVLKPIVDTEVQRAINALSIANPDVSQMVNNVIQLGNTGHFVEVIGKSKRQVKMAIERIKQQSTELYPISAGVDGLVNDLL